MLLLYNTSGRLLLNICVMSHRGNHLSALHDKIPVFYPLKYSKFTTITFDLAMWLPDSLLTSPNCTTYSWPHPYFNNIFTHETITTKILGMNMKVRRVFEYEVQKKIRNDCNRTQTRNHLVRKQILNQMAECSFTN